MTRLIFVAPIVLAACAAPPPPAPIQAVPNPSTEALQALPVGGDVNLLGLQNGCYVYKAPTGVVPLTNPQGLQICA